MAFLEIKKLKKSLGKIKKMMSLFIHVSGALAYNRVSVQMCLGGENSDIAPVLNSADISYRKPATYDQRAFNKLAQLKV